MVWYYIAGAVIGVLSISGAFGIFTGNPKAFLIFCQSNHPIQGAFVGALIGALVYGTIFWLIAFVAGLLL